MTVFGAVAVSTMALTYALEAKHRTFTLAFAASCIASSGYGFAIGSLPFGIVEALWSLVALRRFRLRSG